LLNVVHFTLAPNVVRMQCGACYAT
jgi:hypothetical protein